MANTGFAKKSLRINIDQVFGDRVSASVSSNLINTSARRGISNNDNNGVSPYMVLASTYNFVFLGERDDGSFADNPFERSNPIATVSNMENDEEVWRILVSGQIDWNVLDRGPHTLRLLGTAGVDYFQQKNSLFFPPDLQFEDDDGFPGTSLLSNSDNLNTTLNASAVHTYDWRDGITFTTSAGVQYEARDLDISRFESKGTTAGQPNVSSGFNVNVRQTRALVEDLGFFLQEEVLMLEDRLFLTAGFRLDQSSVNAVISVVALHSSRKFQGPGGSRGAETASWVLWISWTTSNSEWRTESLATNRSLVTGSHPWRARTRSGESPAP